MYVILTQLANAMLTALCLESVTNIAVSASAKRTCWVDSAINAG